MNKITQQLKYVLPALPLGLVAITAAIAASGQGLAHPTSSQPVAATTEVFAQAGPAGSSTQSPVSVTVDGQPIGIKSDGTVNLNTGTSHASVTVNNSSASSQGTSQTTTTTSPDGTVNISVTSNTNGQNGSSHTFYSSFGNSDVSTHSDVNISANGTGNVSVTK